MKRLQMLTRIIKDRKISMIIHIALILLIISCQPKNNSEALEGDMMEEPEDATVTSTLRDNNGNELAMIFNNTEGTVQISFEGETIEMETQNPASGIWYKNDNYELRGKNEEIELTKDGTIIFKIE